MSPWLLCEVGGLAAGVVSLRLHPSFDSFELLASLGVGYFTLTLFKAVTE
jgi:hypothetical protein